MNLVVAVFLQSGYVYYLIDLVSIYYGSATGLLVKSIAVILSTILNFLSDL